MSGLDKLETAFITALALPPNTDVKGAAYGVTEGWDSVAHMALVAEIENTFDIMLDTDEVIGMSSFSKAAEIVANHGVAVQLQQ
jgi:acyl carrier protein